MKTFDRKDVYSVLNAEEARSYINQEGYFANTLSALNGQVRSNRFEILDDVNQLQDFPFITCDEGYLFFLPTDKVKEVKEQKKYRPFKVILEFISTLNSQVGESIRLRAKCSDPFENVFLIDGYSETSKHELKYIYLSGIRYTPEELFKNYEWCSNGKWQPFGVEVKE